MGKDTHAEARPKKKNRYKARSGAHPKQSNEVVVLADVLGRLTAANSDGSVQSQAALLNDTRLQSVQRRVMAAQIGRMQGNIHLQQVVALLKRDEQAVVPHTTSASFLHVQRQPGWSDASQQSAQTSQTDPDVVKGLPAGKGWNAGETQIGSIKRIVIDGLTHGNQSKAEDVGARGSTPESASGKAVVLQHQDFKKEGKKPRVLLHLHGFGSGYRQLDDKKELENQLKNLNNEWNGYKRKRADAIKSGDKDKAAEFKEKMTQTKTKITEMGRQIDRWKLDYAGVLQPGQVRDVELYRMEEQLNALKQPQTIAVLPQGTSTSSSTSGFGDIGTDPIGYLDEVLGKLGVVDYTIALSGHSGGGHSVKRIAKKLEAGDQLHRLDEVILFDANWGGSSDTAKDWLNSHIAEDKEALKNAAAETEADAYFKTRPVLRAFFSPGYSDNYTAIKTITGRLSATRIQVLERQLRELKKDKTNLKKELKAIPKGDSDKVEKVEKLNKELADKDDQIKELMKKSEELQKYVRNKLIFQYQVIGPIKATDKQKKDSEWHEKLMGAPDNPLQEALSALGAP